MPRIQEVGDKIAIALSSLCVVHCVLTPLLIIALPTFGGLAILDHEVFHQVLLFFVVPVGLVALLAGYRHHKNGKVLSCGLAGLFLLTLAGTVAHDIAGEEGETVLTIIASLFIVIAHIQNFRKRNLIRCEHS